MGLSLDEVLVRNNKEMLTSCRTGKLIPIECGEGWWKIIGDCLDTIQSEIMQHPALKVCFTQIKEKFGCLRMYFVIKNRQFNGEDCESSPDIPYELVEKVHQLVTRAVVLARTACEECGVVGELRGGHHIQTLCDKHADERKRPKIDPISRMFIQGDVKAVSEFLKEKEENGELRIRGDRSPNDWAESAKEGPCAGEN